MKSYELTVLVRNEKDIDAAKEIIKEQSGKLGKENAWGKRDLAFPIKKESSAFYFTYDVELEPSSVSEIKKKMNYEEKILRYLLISKE